MALIIWVLFCKSYARFEKQIAKGKIAYHSEDVPFAQGRNDGKAIIANGWREHAISYGIQEFPAAKGLMARNKAEG